MRQCAGLRMIGSVEEINLSKRSNRVILNSEPSVHAQDIYRSCYSSTIDPIEHQNTELIYDFIPHWNIEIITGQDGKHFLLI